MSGSIAFGFGLKSVADESCGCRTLTYEAHTKYEPCLAHALQHAGDMLKMAGEALHRERMARAEEAARKLEEACGS